MINNLQFNNVISAHRSECDSLRGIGCLTHCICLNVPFERVCRICSGALHTHLMTHCEQQQQQQQQQHHAQQEQVRVRRNGATKGQAIVTLSLRMCVCSPHHSAQSVRLDILRMQNFQSSYYTYYTAVYYR